MIPLNAGSTNVPFTDCTATDNSGSVSLTSRSHNPGQRFTTGQTRVEYVFSDPSQNSVTCGFSVNVVEGLSSFDCFHSVISNLTFCTLIYVQVI